MAFLVHWLWNPNSPGPGSRPCSTSLYSLPVFIYNHSLHHLPPLLPSHGSFFCSWNLQIYSLHLLFLPTELFILHLFTCLPPFHHSGLSSKCPLQRGLSWLPIVSSHPSPTLTPNPHPLSSLCFDCIALVTFWFYLGWFIGLLIVPLFPSIQQGHCFLFTSVSGIVP